MMEKVKYIYMLILSLTLSCSLFAQRQMEYLNRGTIAVKTASDSVFVSWRLLGTESDETAFNIYRNYEKEAPVKLNAEPLQKGTNYVDAGVNTVKDIYYTVKPLTDGKEHDAETFYLKKEIPIQQYLDIPLKTPENYSPGDISVGDLDGDGAYEIIVHQAGRGADNSQNGITSDPVFQAYKLDGTLLWEINLGKNIREGAHYTQFMVYDLDGDGRAEFVCKTADGTTDGTGKVIGDGSKDWRELDPKSGKLGRILTGPEFLTVFDGLTGKAVSTVDYIPARGDVTDWGNLASGGKADTNGNRADRFLACIAYLDGKHPSLVMTRGYYAKTVLAAWDFKDGKLVSRWVFDTKDSRHPYSGQGYHSLSVADVDNDGKDEIVFGSMVVDDNGKGLFSTGLGHGDALHVSDLDPDRPGLEVFGIHELKGGAKGFGAALYDAKTGTSLFKGAENEDVGRGVAANIDPKVKGAYMWWSGSKFAYNMKGESVGTAPRSTNFLIWWDEDLSRELLNGNYIEKYNEGRIFTATGSLSINGSKSTPNLSADLFGDWREEVIFRAENNQSLRVYTTIIPTDHRQYTFMHDPQYRLSIAWQNVGYNQPPHTGFYFGTGMSKAPKPDIVTIRKK